MSSFRDNTMKLHPLCYAQRLTGQMLLVLGQASIGCITLGVLFAMAFPTLNGLLVKPEEQLRLQAFQINYFEMIKRTQSVSDPDWDGALSGMSLGYALTRGYPFVIPAFGAAVGAVVGYELDSRI